MSIKQRAIHSDYRIIGVFATAAAYLADRNASSASEGDIYYDTTANELRTYDGSNWSAAGQSGTSAGSLDSAANVGTKITIDGGLTTGVEIEATDGIISTDGALLLLDNDDTGSDVHCLDLTNAGTAPAIQFTAGQAGDDIQGTADTWAVTSAGVATFDGGIQLLADSKTLSIGASSDITMQFVDGWSGAKDTGLLIASAVSNDQIQIGDDTYELDVWICGTTAQNKVLWDASADAMIFNNTDILLGDGDRLELGDASNGDVSLNWDGNYLLIEAAADNTGQIRMGSTNAIDLAIYGSTVTDIALWDVNTGILELTGWDVHLLDSDELQIGTGTGGDVSMTWNGSNLLIEALTDNTGQIRLGSTNSMDFVIYDSAATGTYTFDCSASILDINGCDVRLQDDDYLLFGNSATAGLTTDATMRWDSSNTELEIIGETNFEDTATFTNIVVTGTFTHSGDYDPGSISLDDNEILYFGTGNDVLIDYNSVASELHINGAAANQGIVFGATTQCDVEFIGANYDIQWDAHRDYLLFNDNAAIAFGGAKDGVADYEIATAGSTGHLVVSTSTANDGLRIGSGTVVTDFVVENATTTSANFWFDGSGDSANGTVFLGVDGKGIDMKWFSENASDYILWDMDLNTNGVLVFEGAAANFTDATLCTFGTGGGAGDGDMKIYGDSSAVLHIDAVSTDTGTIEIGADGEGIDVLFYGDTSTSNLLWDESEDCLYLRDDTILGFGGTTAPYDLAITSDGTNVTMNINDDLSFTCTAANDQIIFGDGTFGLDVKFTGTANSSAYVLWDASGDAGSGLWAFGQDSQGIDVTFYGDSTGKNVVWDSSADSWSFGATDSLGIDVKFWGSATTTNMLWDASIDTLEMSNNVSLGFGTTSVYELTITSDGTNATQTIQGDMIFAATAATDAIQIGDGTFGVDFQMAGTVDSAAIVMFDASGDSNNGAWFFGADDHGVDVVLYGATTSVSLTWDQSADTLTAAACSIVADLNGVFENGLILPTKAGTGTATQANAVGAILYDSTLSGLTVCTAAGVWKGVTLT